MDEDDTYLPFYQTHSKNDCDASLRPNPRHGFDVVALRRLSSSSNGFQRSQLCTLDSTHPICAPNLLSDVNSKYLTALRGKSGAGRSSDTGSEDLSTLAGFHIFMEFTAQMWPGLVDMNLFLY